MKVLKFGGSSVGSAERIEKVIEIVTESKKKHKRIAVVVSAFQGITDQLIFCGKLAEKGDEKYLDELKSIETRHLEGVKSLIPIKEQSCILAQVKMKLNDLEDVVNGVSLIKELSLRTLDFVMSFGERLSAYIISEALKSRNHDSIYVDTRELIRTDDNFSSARVDFKKTNKNIQKYFENLKGTALVTGFIARDENKVTTTLGRGGSDYTASILGSALKAEEIEIWTDVDGVMTSNPKSVKKAFSIDNLTYEEAMEMSHFGAKVIHPPTMQPAMDKKIPIRIRNTFNPKFEGTLISPKNLSSSFIIKGISSISEISLLRVQGSGMIGVTGVSMRLFSALAKGKVNVILISQASSEHTVCFAVDPSDAKRAKKSIEKEFELEINAKLVDKVLIEEDLSIVAIVGENMRNQPGISGKLFQSFGGNGINVVAIAQGSSELNISVVIPKKDEVKALNAIHDSFFLSQSKTLNVYLVGTGLIGSTLLSQISKQKDYLLKDHNLEVQIAGIANASKMILNEDGIDINDWETNIKEKGNKMDLVKYLEQMNDLNLPNSIFVDCTANEKIVSKYEIILKSSTSIVTPNKKANSASMKNYKKLKNAAKKGNTLFLYETNVGAGLPIISTLNDLKKSGDHITKIEALLSGTLTYIFSEFDGSIAFSQIVKDAKEKGYTEPDPRDDLNGMDVKRKLLILAREAGIEMEMNDIKLGNLIPAEIDKEKSVEEFMEKLKKFDDYFLEKYLKAKGKNKALRYVAELNEKKAEIKLKEIDNLHPLYSVNGSDNIVSFTTGRYSQTPLVVKGPGAGAEVTAAGVFADIIRIGLK